MPRHWLAMLFAFMGLPALAQTDDRVLNDVVTVMAGYAAMDEAARQCAALAPGDTEIAAAFDGFRDRSTPWLVIAISLISTRGGLDPEALAAARSTEIERIHAGFERDPNALASCRETARSFAANDTDLAALYPAETRRMSEARAGKWPALDIAHSPEVADAIAMRQFFFMREVLLDRCGELTGDARLYRDARSYWNQQNYDAFYYAHQVLTNWGALAPGHLAGAKSAGRAEAEAALTAEGIARCNKFVAGLEDGDEDVAKLVPDLLERVRAAAEIEP